MKNAVEPIIHISDNVLAPVNETKDLGIIFNKRLDFKSHINAILARAYVRSTLIHNVLYLEMLTRWFER